MSNFYSQLSDIPYMLSAEKLAVALSISKSNAYVLMNSTGFPSIRIGKRLLVNKDSLCQWLKSKEESGGNWTCQS